MENSQKNESEKLHLNIQSDPYNYAMRTIFGKWKPFILQAMHTDQAHMTRFSRFMKQLPISQKVLTENLKQLEEDGLIFRTVIPTNPPQTEYRLTEAGGRVIPLLNAVYQWGWKEMTRRKLPIDALGEMWQGIRDPDEKIMRHPYKKPYAKVTSK